MQFSKMKLSAHEAALLSEACYTDFDPGDDGVLSNDEIKGQLVGKGFSKSQANDFVTRWEVVYQERNTPSGFSATLFKSKDPNAAQPYVVAVRGTEFGLQWRPPFFTADVQADVGDIILDGITIDQTIDLYNFMQRIATPKGQAFRLKSLMRLDEDPDDVDASRRDVIFDATETWRRVRTIVDSTFSQGVLEQPVDVSQIMGAVGHSLGGHLATALTRLFPGLEATTINGAGFALGIFKGLSGHARANIRNLFHMLGGTSEYDGSKMVNYYGYKNPEFVTQHAALRQAGGHEPIYIEQDTFWGNVLGHGSGQMNDSFAVFRLMQGLNKDLSLSQIDWILTAISEDEGMTLEQTLERIGRLFWLNGTPARNDREQLYVKLNELNAKGRPARIQRQSGRCGSGWAARREPQQWPPPLRGRATPQTARIRRCTRRCDSCRPSQSLPTRRSWSWSLPANMPVRR
ncbi:hypothetical protein [Vandammella animalimorsus]|uniref:hypothetical protein n=1 Tax=Vandammella animalimorsus TaxID=2029117 RepID=UPI001177D009|nr:hypothetical protein [Vandammella animalimorsus]